jgi:hypothetical protein
VKIIDPAGTQTENSWSSSPLPVCYTCSRNLDLHEGNYATDLHIIRVKYKLILPYPLAGVKLYFVVLTQSGSIHTVAESGEFENNLESTFKKLVQ